MKNQNGESVEKILEEVAMMGVGSGAGFGSSTRDITEDEEYQKFVESMVPHCRCTAQPRPCDGVLAGGLCDNLHDDRALYDDDRVSLAYESDDLPPMDRPEDF